GNDLREDALIPGLAGSCRCDSVEAAKKGYPQKQRCEDQNQAAECEAGISHCRLSKDWNSVADGFYSGQGGAATGKCMDEEPSGGCFRNRHNRVCRHHWGGVAIR